MVSFKHIVYLLLFQFLVLGINAQHYNYPLNNYSQVYYELGQSRMDSFLVTSVRGLPESWLELDSVWGYEPIKETMYSKTSAVLLRDHHVTIEREELKVHVDLLINFEVGREERQTTDYADTVSFSRNMRGFLIRGEIGDKVSFQTTFREDQTNYAYYLKNRILNSTGPADGAGVTGVAPGGGRVKQSGKLGLDNSIAEGYISYSPIPQLNLQFGHQKNFIGSGYRSLLLSDNAYTYPQLKASARLLKGRLHYHTMMGTMHGLRRLPPGDTPEALFRRKGFSFHYLEFRPHKRLSVGLFEGVMWQRFIHNEGPVSLPLDRYIPLIGLNTLTRGLESEHNSVIGADIGLQVLSGLKTYGQYIVDAEGQTGFQVGIKSADLPIRNLRIQVEYNSVEPYAYAHPVALQSYTQMNQGIAHPRGAGVDELSFGAMYMYRRWFADLRVTMAEQLLDQPDSTNIGSNINISELEVGNYAPSEISRSNYSLLTMGYLFNPNSNFNIYISWLYRDETGPITYGNNSLISFGLHMNMYNRYEDL